MLRLARLKPLIAVMTLVISVFPVRAQDAFSLLDWIADGSAGFVTIRADDTMANVLGLSLQTAQVLQPGRVRVGDDITLDDFFPFTLFDIEDFNFATMVAPWLAGEMAFVYRELGPGFAVADADFLWLFETDDTFGALTALRPVLRGQDNTEILSGSEDYRGFTLFEGDQATFGVGPGAVLLGSDSMIRLAIDTALGDSARLVTDPVYRDVRAQSAADAPIFAYFSDEAAAAALSVLLGSSDNTPRLLRALGQAVYTTSDRDTLAAALLRGEVDALSVSVIPDIERVESVRAVAVVHTQQVSPVDVPAAADEVLAFIPRNAAVVQSGSDALNAAYWALLALPMSNYAGTLVGQFPVPVSDTPASDTAPLPTSDDLRNAFEGLSAAFERLSAYNLERELLDHLEGSFAVALLPRPNAPVPFFNTPYDLLIVAQTNAGAAVREGAARLVQQYIDAEFFTHEVFGDVEFIVLRQPRTQELILSIGAVDDVLIVATGTAVNLALRAESGDNRLVDQPRWRALTGARAPELYIDINPYFNLVAPQVGGSMPIPFQQVGIESHYLGSNLYRVAVTVTITAR
jgi:hypothetical protein